MANRYRLSRESKRADSSSGGKDYHLVLISNLVNNRRLLISRWAKAGQWGNGWKVEQFASEGDATRAWRKIAQAKFEGEYRETIVAPTEKYFENHEERQKALGAQYWSKLGSHLEWLIPGVGMGDKEPEAPFYDEDAGRMRRRPKAPPVERQPEPEPTIEDRVKENPLWGSW